MSAPDFASLPDAAKAAAEADYDRYVEAHAVFGTTAQPFGAWWERYYETYTDPFAGLS